MSETLEQPTQQSIDYMVRLLQMNPVQKCEEIISARSAELGQPSSADLLKQAATQSQADRQNVLARLDRLRAEFWTLPQAALEERLAQLNTQGYADVAAAVARLRIVAAHRDQFPKLAEKLKFDRYILDSLKDILTKPPREVLSLKEHELADLASGGNRKRGRRFVKMVKREIPAIYQLESDWLESISRQKAEGTVFVASRRGAPGLVRPAKSGNYWWIVGVVVFGVIRILLMLPDANREPNHYRPTYPPPSNWQPPSWQPNRTRAPSDTQENDSSRGQRPGETRPVPSFGIDKDVWKPYQSSDQSEDRNQTNPRSRQEIDELLKPPSPNPSTPANKQDDRYSR